ncbi:MAG: DUF6894 family protein [Xanthobacteraceae bacterium]
MPRYYFRLTDGKETLKSGEGLDLIGNAAAREEAMRLASSIKQGKTMQERKWDGWFVLVLDEHGKQVDSVPIDAAPGGLEVKVP